MRYEDSHSPQGEYSQSRASLVFSGSSGSPELTPLLLVLKPWSYSHMQFLLDFRVKWTWRGKDLNKIIEKNKGEKEKKKKSKRSEGGGGERGEDFVVCLNAASFLLLVLKLFCENLQRKAPSGPIHLVNCEEHCYSWKRPPSPQFIAHSFWMMAHLWETCKVKSASRLFSQ